MLCGTKKQNKKHKHPQRVFGGRKTHAKAETLSWIVDVWQTESGPRMQDSQIKVNPKSKFCWLAKGRTNKTLIITRRGSACQKLTCKQMDDGCSHTIKEDETKHRGRRRPYIKGGGRLGTLGEYSRSELTHTNTQDKQLSKEEASNTQRPGIRYMKLTLIER